MISVLVQILLISLANIYFAPRQIIFAGYIKDNELITKPIDFQISPNDLCSSNPRLVESIVLLGNELGVSLLKGTPKLPGKDATYEAFHGRLGAITITNKSLTSVTYCQLITHEYIHVLQHLKGGLKLLLPMGWPLTYNQIYSQESLQEAEAYAYQDNIGKVYYLLRLYMDPK